MQDRIRRQPRAGFTLIELLVVIGIIVILVGILLPVVSVMRKKAQFTDTLAEVTRIAESINHYYQDYRSYPGPIPESQIYGNNNVTSQTVAITAAPPSPLTSPTLTTITSSENLVLGLCGALQISSSGAVQYNVNQINKGPMSLNPLSPQQVISYFDATPAELTSAPIPTTSSTNIGYTSWNSTQGSTYASPQLVAPEFMDHFSNPHPIIYLRAMNGSQGMVDNMTYTPGSAGSPPTGGTPTTSSQYYSMEMSPYWKGSGSTPFPSKTDASSGTIFFPTVQSFFYNNSINDGVTPRSKDSYILISPGYDGIYGTSDDVIYSN